MSNTEAREALATKADLVDLQTDLEIALHKQTASIIKWFAGAVLAQTVILATIMKMFVT